MIRGLCGVYLYGDYGSGNISGLGYNGRTVTTHTTLFESHRSITSFGEDEQHELYLVDHQGDILIILL